MTEIASPSVPQHCRLPTRFCDAAATDDATDRNHKSRNPAHRQESGVCRNCAFRQDNHQKYTHTHTLAHSRRRRRNGMCVMTQFYAVSSACDGLIHAAAAQPTGSRAHMMSSAMSASSPPPLPPGPRVINALICNMCFAIERSHTHRHRHRQSYVAAARALRQKRRCLIIMYLFDVGNYTWRTEETETNGCIDQMRRAFASAAS